MLSEKTITFSTFDQRLITDPKLIEKYDKEFDYKFFIPKHELKLLDREIVMEGYYEKSRKVLDKAIQPIYVAICETDKHKNENHPERVHGRLPDGNNRYQGSLIAKTRWPVQYMYVSDYRDFVMLWTHMGSNKKTGAKQTKQRIIDFCKNCWSDPPDEIKDEKGNPHKDRISVYVLDVLGKAYSKSTLLLHIPQEYKSAIGLARGKASSVKKKKMSAKEIELEKAKEEVKSLQQELFDLKQRSLPESKKDVLIRQLEEDKAKSKLRFGLLKSSLKMAMLQDSTKFIPPPGKYVSEARLEKYREKEFEKWFGETFEQV